MNRCQIITGDCRQALKELPSGSVHCCVTSPPYWGLRDYGVAEQIGLEASPDAYVETMRKVFAEVWRVLRDDGTLWLNLGDSYSGSGKGGNPDEGKQATNRGSQTIGTLYGKTGESARMAAVTNVSRRLCAEQGVRPKNLIGIPWRVALALQADGWYLRSDIIWHKPNPMPESVTDRPTKSHEYLFLMSKAERYFYDAEAIAEKSVVGDCGSSFVNGKTGIKNLTPVGQGERVDDGRRNKRSVWTVPSQAYPESHFATFPEDLIKPCILAGTSAKGCCPKCGAPWERVVERVPNPKGFKNGQHREPGRDGGLTQRTNGNPTLDATGKLGEPITLGWQPTCDCGEEQTAPCTVLDPFGGSGTTGQVALELGRKAILIELNPKYVTLIENRTHVTPGLPLA